MKVNDTLTKRRLFVASTFKQFDNLAQGNVKTALFPSVYQKIVDANYLNSKRHKLSDIYKAIDPYNKGKIEMNRFIEWMSSVSFF
jgi:Ca2+-binding EF-hand superfamily protein